MSRRAEGSNLDYVLFYLTPRSPLATSTSVRRSTNWACDELGIPRAAVLIDDPNDHGYIPVIARRVLPPHGKRRVPLAVFADWNLPVPPEPPVLHGSPPANPWTHKKSLKHARRNGWAIQAAYKHERRRSL